MTTKLRHLDFKVNEFWGQLDSEMDGQLTSKLWFELEELVLIAAEEQLMPNLYFAYEAIVDEG